MGMMVTVSVNVEGCGVMDSNGPDLSILPLPICRRRETGFSSSLAFPSPISFFNHFCMCKCVK